jgi:predicted metal-dependent phosphoesterase TrpH
MQDVITYVTTNWDGIFAAILAVHAAAVAIVNLTPTPKDDAILAKVYGVIEIAAGLFTKKAKS